MLAVKNLERLIEIEADLKSQYQAELNSKSTQITRAVEKQEELKAEIAKHQSTIAEQLETIKTLSASTSEGKRIEQLNRELNARATKLQDEFDTQKKRVKSLQKDLAVEREELKALKQFDPQKMKKNLDTSKKKLAEKTAANELLQKSYNEFKRENETLKKKVKELEAKVETEESAEAS
jgi:chromosome segregation ATPase